MKGRGPCARAHRHCGTVQSRDPHLRCCIATIRTKVLWDWSPICEEGEMPETTVNVRYMVDDVDAAIAWYTQHLGFEILSKAGPAFADVRRGPLRLLLSGPKSSAGRP